MNLPAAAPLHIAVVMDGNGRWAKRRMLPRLAGHKQGVNALQRCVKACAERGIGALTVFAFSSENWNRPEDEVSGLMELLARAIGREVPALAQDGIRLRFVGAREGLSDAMLQNLARAEASTAHCTRMLLNVCFNYGGRWDIAQAAAALAERGEAITPSNLDKAMALSFARDPDLLIRTGGEMRLSNFLLWQAAYTELFFSDKLWPDFDEAELDAALRTYYARERRYGLISEQLCVDAPVQASA